MLEGIRVVELGVWVAGPGAGGVLADWGADVIKVEAPAGYPMINSYQDCDGRWFWLLGVESDRLWPKLLAAIDRKDWADDERFRTARDRRHNATALIALLDELFATRTRDEWTADFDEHDVWWAPVNTIAEVVEDPQAIAAGAFVDMPQVEGEDPYRAVASPVDFDGHGHRPGKVPEPGEHTAEVLAELGF